MAYLNLNGARENAFDAIVVGTGISGGWAAKELCEKGLSTLVLERGRDIKHIIDYKHADKDPWDWEGKGAIHQEDYVTRPKQLRSGPVHNKNIIEFFVNDLEHPYNEEKRYDWIRGYQVGGRSFAWHRRSLRLSDLDFEANAADGHGIDWPIRYKDISEWYSYVERHIGVSGNRDGIPHLPDGEFMPAFELNAGEKHAKRKIEAAFPDRKVIVARCANLTEAKDHRGKCQSRNRCVRGCPYGASFSSLSGTLPYAEATGNMTLKTNAIVSSVIYDADSNRAVGVRVVDKLTLEETDYYAKIIFLNASTIATTAILLNSRSERFPNGMGNDSGQLGYNLVDHAMGPSAGGILAGYEDRYYKGMKPSSFYIPRFRNLNAGQKTKGFLRGYGIQGQAFRANWNRGKYDFGFGGKFKDEMMRPGPWHLQISAFMEALPNPENKMYLDFERKDRWGQPTVTFNASFGENERKMSEDAYAEVLKMMDACGADVYWKSNELSSPGSSIHEMGTARMGRDPKTSVLNGHNQIHAVPNVFVTDGACMTSTACQNPSLTYMALTARAANFAVQELKNGRL